MRRAALRRFIAETAPLVGPFIAANLLLIAVCIAQLLDLLTWLAMPPAAEVNAVARNLHSTDAWLLKSLVVVLVVCLQPALRPRYAAVGEGLALLAVAAGMFGAGSNVAAIAWVAG